MRLEQAISILGEPELQAGIYKSTMVLASGRCSAICQRGRSFRVMLKKWQLLCFAPCVMGRDRIVNSALPRHLGCLCVSISLCLVKLELSVRYVGVR
jgi:hypothetical protein